MLAGFAKNYLPLLFNIYTGDAESPKDPKKLSVFETIKCYMQVADSEVGVESIQSSIYNYSAYLTNNSL